jgi:hypothetical protein
MKFLFSAVSATFLVTAICSPIMEMKGSSFQRFPLRDARPCLQNGLEATQVANREAEVAYDYGEYSVSAKDKKRDPEVAYDYGEYSVTAKDKKREAEVAYDYGEYSVEA